MTVAPVGLEDVVGSVQGFVLVEGQLEFFGQAVGRFNLVALRCGKHRIQSKIQA